MEKLARLDGKATIIFCVETDEKKKTACKVVFRKFADFHLLVDFSWQASDLSRKVQKWKLATIIL